MTEVNEMVVKEEVPSKARASIWHTKDFPYVFTVLLAALSFQLNYIIKDLTEAPVLEYTQHNSLIRKIPGGNLYELEYELTNISKGTRFDSLIFSFSYSAGINRNIRIWPVATVVQRSDGSTYDGNSPKTSRYGADFLFKNFQPDFGYRCLTRIEMDSGEFVYPAVYIYSNNQLNLQKTGFKSFLIKNQFVINCLITLLFLVMTIVYFAKFKKTVV